MEEWLWTLEEQARESGGAVYHLLGNHEVSGIAPQTGPRDGDRRSSLFDLNTTCPGIAFFVITTVCQRPTSLHIVFESFLTSLSAEVLSNQPLNSKGLEAIYRC